MNKGVKLSAVTIAPGERVDLVLDFSAYGGLLPALLQPTVNVDVTNSAPTPFPGGGAPVGGATLVMRFSVSLNFNLLKADPSPWLLPLQNLRPLLPQLAAVPTVPSKVRRVLLAEGVDEYGRITPMLGTYDPTGVANQGTLSLHDPITETPTVGTSEVWEFWNTTVDSHPVHMHLVDFRVLNRQAFNGSVGAKVMSNGWDGVVLQPGAALIGAAVAAPATEQGAKDTVVCPSGQVTRIVVNFKRRGTYVYHCHILSHEEHDMMRFYKVV
jgi:spore coat protein A